MIVLNLFKKIRAFYPIRIFITSRLTKELSVVARSDSELFIHDKLSIADTLPDIKTYVHQVVNSGLPYSKLFRETMISQVVAKSSGSFLWVKLVLNTLKDNWHTGEDVRRALNDVPSGMERLYQKMIASVVDHQPRLRTIALRILSWVACASCPLRLSELRVVLSAEFGDFVSLENTVVQICGQFVSVEHSMIFLIHATARQYLFDHTSQPAIINLHRAHEHAAWKCLEFLSNKRWRQVFIQISERDSMFEKIKRPPLTIFEEEHPFLWYALKNWAFHVSNAPVVPGALMPVLVTFLKRHCLAWIHAMALSGDLQHIIRASQCLKAFLRRYRRPAIGADLKTLSYTSDENIESIKS